MFTFLGGVVVGAVVVLLVQSVLGVLFVLAYYGRRQERRGYEAE